MPRSINALKSLLKELEWQIDTPLFDRFLFFGMLKIMGIFVPVLILVALFNFYAFLIILLTGILTSGVVLFGVFYVGHRQIRFRVDTQGAAFVTPRTIRGANRVLGFLTMFLGISQGRLSASLIGWSQASLGSSEWGGDSIAWSDVRGVALHPRERVVVLKEKWFTGGLGGGLRSFRLYCTPENYQQVATLAIVSVSQNSRKKRFNHEVF